MHYRLGVYHWWAYSPKSRHDVRNEPFNCQPSNLEAAFAGRYVVLFVVVLIFLISG